jgi:hypothetical protein
MVLRYRSSVIERLKEHLLTQKAYQEFKVTVMDSECSFLNICYIRAHLVVA